MSNTQRPKAAMNGQGTERRPGQIELLSVIAGGVQALAQDASRKPPGQRWHCAVCLGRMRGWEVKHQAQVQEIGERYQQAMTAWAQAMNDAASDPPMQAQLQQAQPDLPAMCRQYGEACGDPMPAVNEAQFLITLATGQVAAVCAIEVPAGFGQIAGQPRLYAVQGSLSSAMVQAARSG